MNSLLLKSGNRIAAEAASSRREPVASQLVWRGRVRCLAVSEDAPAAADAAPQRTKTIKRPIRKLKINRPKALNWDRWELRQYYRLEGMREVDNIDDEDASSSGLEGGVAQEALAQHYFTQYDNPAAHLPYLRDKAMLSAYRSAIETNAKLIKGKIVVDIGCGPGLPFSLMCAEAGAKRIYAIEGSTAAAAAAEKVVAAAGLEDVIMVCQGAAENLKFQEKADVLVSNWMGPLLLSGGMLKTVLQAKKRFLKRGGLLLPDIAEIFVCGIEDRDYLMGSKEKWDNMAGFDMGSVMTQVVKYPRLDTLTRPSQLVTSTDVLVQLDLDELDESDISDGMMDLEFTLNAKKDERIFALMMYFDVSFAFGGKIKPPFVTFSTKPQNSPTHFKQLILNFPRGIQVEEGDKIDGKVSVLPVPWDNRQLEVQVEVEYKGVKATTAYALHTSLSACP